MTDKSDYKFRDWTTEITFRIVGGQDMAIQFADAVYKDVVKVADNKPQFPIALFVSCKTGKYGGCGWSIDENTSEHWTHGFLKRDE